MDLASGSDKESRSSQQRVYPKDGGSFEKAYVDQGFLEQTLAVPDEDKAFYDPDALVGTQVLFIANLEPRTIRGEISQGMILAGSDIHEVDEDGKPTERDVVVLRPDKPVKAGSPVS